MTRFAIPLVLLSLSLPSFAGAQTNGDSAVRGDGSTSTHDGRPGGFVPPLPDPVDPGNFCVCEDAEQTYGRYNLPTQLYWPGGPSMGGSAPSTCSGTQACSTVYGLNRPLIFGSPALGREIYDYGTLGRHLASHGFVVMMVGNDVDNLETQLADAIDFAESEFGFALSNETGLFGHSMGGHSMAWNSFVVEMKGRNLGGLALLAPHTKDGMVYPLNFINSLLAVHWTTDDDGATYGNPDDDGYGSVFQMYDAAGKFLGMPDFMTITKDMLFFDFPGFVGHYAENEPGLVAYVTAFMRRQLLGESGQDKWLRFQNPLPLAPAQLPIGQQHEQPGRLMLANFATNPIDVPPLFDTIDSDRVTVDPFMSTWDDEFSPHDEMVLPLTVEDAAGKRWASIELSQTVDATDWNYLSFRITQRYHSTENPTGGTLDFKVGFELTGGSRKLVPASNYAQLDFPVEYYAEPTGTIGAGAVNMTKNAMRTFLIPLSDFGVPLDQVEAVVFDFSDAPAERYLLALDDVELAE